MSTPPTNEISSPPTSLFSVSLDLSDPRIQLGLHMLKPEVADEWPAGADMVTVVRHSNGKLIEYRFTPAEISLMRAHLLVTRAF